jgi:hypothetical protein
MVGLGGCKMFKTIHIGAVILTAAYMMISCSTNSPGAVRLVTAYLPYVEIISITEPVTAGESVQVTVSLSAQLKPDALNGLLAEPITTGYPGGWFPGWIQGGVNTLDVYLHPWISEPIRTGAPVTEYTFNLGLFEPGTYRLLVQTASSSQWGGLSGQYNAGSPFGDIPTHPHAEYREYTFTVLPAEE